MARNFDELLSQIHMGNQEGKTYLSDTEEKFTVDTLTREIIIPVTFNRNIAVTNDYNSNEVTFTIALEIDGHHITDCNKKAVKWHNISSNVRGWSELNSEIKENSLELTWVIPPEATTAAGPLHFAICFCDTTPEGKITYKWNSLVCNQLSVAQGLDTVSMQGAPLTQIITIDSISRQLMFSNDFNKTIGYVGDFGINKITFRSKRFINEVDLKNHNVVIQYTNAEATYGEDHSITEVSILEDLGGNEKDDLLEFDWYLPNQLLSSPGSVEIIVTFYIADQDGGFLHTWNSAPGHNFIVGEGRQLSSF